jgi:acyl-coenzyme A thioesterase PaaI-like protein
MSGTITARAEVRRCGKRLAVVEATATDEQGALLAVATATHSLLKRRSEPPATEPDRS